MQYHFVVGYDTELKQWFVDTDIDSHFPEGSVWDDDKTAASCYADSGWIAPEDVTPQQSALDAELLQFVRANILNWELPDPNTPPQAKESA